MVLARRNLLRIPRAPDLLLSFTVQPIMFVLLFVYVFGGAISTPGYDYVDFLMPGIIVQTMAFGGFVTALGLAEDLKKGLIDRFRSLPIARSAVLAGRTLADVGTNMISLVDDARRGPAGGLLVLDTACSRCWRGVALLLLFGYAFSWVFAFLGLSRVLGGGGAGARLHRRLPAHLRLVRLRARPTRCPAGSSASPTRTRSPPSWTRSAHSGSAPRPAPTCGWPSSGRWA